MDSRAVGTLRFQLCFLSCKATDSWLGSHPGLWMSSWACCESTENEAAILCPTLPLSLQVNSGASMADPVSFLHMHQIAAWVTLQAPLGSLHADNCRLHPRSVLWSPGFSAQPSQMAQKVKDPPAIKETWVQSLVQENCSRSKWQPTPVSLPGKSHEPGELQPKGCKELDTAEHLCAPADVLSGWGLQWDGPSVQASLCSTCCRPLAAFSPKPLKLSLSTLISPAGEAFSRVKEHFLFHSSLPGVQILSQFPFSFFSPTLLCGDLSCILVLWALLPVFSRYSVSFILHTDMSVGGEFHVLLLHHLALVLVVVVVVFNFCGPRIYCYK